MRTHFTQIKVTFEESPMVEIQPITKGARVPQEKRQSSWLDWFK